MDFSISRLLKASPRRHLNNIARGGRWTNDLIVIRKEIERIQYRGERRRWRILFLPSYCVREEGWGEDLPFPAVASVSWGWISFYLCTFYSGTRLWWHEARVRSFRPVVPSSGHPVGDLHYNIDAGYGAVSHSRLSGLWSACVPRMMTCDHVVQCDVPLGYVFLCCWMGFLMMDHWLILDGIVMSVSSLRLLRLPWIQGIRYCCYCRYYCCHRYPGHFGSDGQVFCWCWSRNWTCLDCLIQSHESQSDDRRSDHPLGGSASVHVIIIVSLGPSWLGRQCLCLSINDFMARKERRTSKSWH